MRSAGEPESAGGQEDDGPTAGQGGDGPRAGRPGDFLSRGIERFALFSDAVIAIAITLLAIELPVPRGDTASGLWTRCWRRTATTRRS